VSEVERVRGVSGERGPPLFRRRFAGTGVEPALYSAGSKGGTLAG